MSWSYSTSRDSLFELRNNMKTDDAALSPAYIDEKSPLLDSAPGASQSCYLVLKHTNPIEASVNPSRPELWLPTIVRTDSLITRSDAGAKEEEEGRRTDVRQRTAFRWGIASASMVVTACMFTFVVLSRMERSDTTLHR